MLDTLLQIGNTLRNSEAGKIRHHRYIKTAPLADNKTSVVYWTVPVNENFEIEFDRREPLINQNVIEKKLFYLTFKASETSPENKYLFGDICYGEDKTGKNIAFYKLGNSEKKGLSKLGSFLRGEKDAKEFEKTIIGRFRNSFSEQVETIENFLQENGKNQQVFLNFDFNGKFWYEFDLELQKINEALLGYFTEKQGEHFIISNFIYKTLIAKSLSQSPNFNYKNIFKTKSFEKPEDVLDLVYALNYSKRALVSERDVKVVVLPKGENLKAEHIEDFFKRAKDDESEATELLNISNQPQIESEDDGFGDSLFKAIIENVDKSITQYDFIFSKRGDKGKDEDLLELSGIERSFLNKINERIAKIKQSELLDQRAMLYPKRPKQFINYDVRRSLFNVLGDPNSSKNKKYQSHLFKVLPRIYAGNYFRDAVLLPAFIEKVEYNIRSTESGKLPDYNLLKYDYYFLVLIRNDNGEKDMEEMKTSPSFQAGLLLGKMAQPLKFEINSFEKNYVGLLSRRISDKQGLIKFANFINEKLVLHAPNRGDLRKKFVEFSQIVGDLRETDYRKNYCAFGFFESYFDFGKKESAEQIEETQGEEN